MSRRLVLVGIMVLAWRGSVVQLVLASVFCLVYLQLQLQAGPYRSLGDDYLAGACSFALCATFLVCLIFKMGNLLEVPELLARMSPKQRADYHVRHCPYITTLVQYGLRSSERGRP